MYTFRVVAVIVLIGPADALPALGSQLTDSPLQTFTEYQVREAVEFIATHTPDVLAIEQQFAVSPRGEALIGRIMDDPSLTGCQIRIVERPAVAGRDSARKKSGAGLATAAAASVVPAPTAAPSPHRPAPAGAFDRHGTRRAERIRLVAGVAVTVDGNPAELVDLSTAGAQVISRMVLRPNQRVRMQLPESTPEGRRAVRCSASVVWASYEMPSGQAPRYRAGLRLTSGEPDAIQQFAAQHRAPASGEPD